MSFGTWLSISAEPGVHVLIPPEVVAESRADLDGMVVGSLTVLEEKTDVIQPSVEAMLDASRTYSQHPDQWGAAMSRARDDLPLDKLEATAKLFTPSWCVNAA